jgi:hypothetical protein
MYQTFKAAVLDRGPSDSCRVRSDDVETRPRPRRPRLEMRERRRDFSRSLSQRSSGFNWTDDHAYDAALNALMARQKDILIATAWPDPSRHRRAVVSMARGGKKEGEPEPAPPRLCLAASFNGNRRLIGSAFAPRFCIRAMCFRWTAGSPALGSVPATQPAVPTQRLGTTTFMTG